MSGRLYRICLTGVLAVGICAAPALADAGGSDTVARLEALLEAQQKQIEALEQQVAAASQQDMDQQRTAQMKQQIREVLSESEFRESLMPSTLQAGYDDGFFIRSSDDKFMIKFNGLMQWRFTHYGIGSTNRYLLPGFQRNDRTGFDGNRLRFIVSGHAYNKDLTYSITFDSSESVNYNTRVLYAWVNYRFVDEFQIKTGIFRLASTRADFGSTSTMQFPEYPMTNASFGLGRGLGVRFWGKLMEGQGEYYLDIVNKFTNLGEPGLGRTITNDEDVYTLGHDNNPGIVFRTVWAIMGGHCLYPDDEPHFTSPCDMGMHDEPALNVGMHYAFTEDEFDGELPLTFNRRTFFRDGGFGLTSSEGTQVHQVGFDTGFKYQGFSATAEYMFRIVDVRDSGGLRTAPLFQLTGDDSTNLMHGAYVQCGYFLPIPGMERKFEVVGRIGGVRTNLGGGEGVWYYAGGFNYYIEGHAVKLQTDLTKVYEAPIAGSQYSLANVNDDALIWRLQLQVAF